MKIANKTRKLLKESQLRVLLSKVVRLAAIAGILLLGTVIFENIQNKDILPERYFYRNGKLTKISNEKNEDEESKVSEEKLYKLNNNDNDDNTPWPITSLQPSDRIIFSTPALQHQKLLLKLDLSSLDGSTDNINIRVEGRLEQIIDDYSNSMDISIDVGVEGERVAVVTLAEPYSTRPSTHIFTLSAVSFISQSSPPISTNAHSGDDTISDHADILPSDTHPSGDSPSTTQPSPPRLSSSNEPIPPNPIIISLSLSLYSLYPLYLFRSILFPLLLILTINEYRYTYTEDREYRLEWVQYMLWMVILNEPVSYWLFKYELVWINVTLSAQISVTLYYLMVMMPLRATHTLGSKLFKKFNITIFFIVDTFFKLSKYDLFGDLSDYSTILLLLMIVKRGFLCFNVFVLTRAALMVEIKGMESAYLGMALCVLSSILYFKFSQGFHAQTLPVLAHMMCLYMYVLIGTAINRMNRGIKNNDNRSIDIPDLSSNVESRNLKESDTRNGHTSEKEI